MKWIIAGSLLLVLAASCGHKPEVKKDALPSRDSIAASQLNKNVDRVKYADPDSALYFLSRVRTIYDRNHFANGLMDVYFGTSYIYCAVLSDTITGKKYVDSAWHLAGTPGNEAYRYKAYAGYGIYYFLTGNYQKSAEYYLKAMHVQPHPVDSVFFLNTSAALAQIYSYERNDEAASDYYEPMVRYIERQPSSALKVIILMNASSFANKQNAKGEARCRKYLFAAKEVAESIGDTSVNYMLFTNLASYYLRAGVGDSSVFFAQKAIAGGDAALKSLGGVTAPFEIMIQHNINQGDFVQAKENLQRLERLTDVLVFPDLEMESIYYDLKYRILKHEGSTQAALAALEKRGDVEVKLAKIEKDEQLLDHEKALKKTGCRKNDCNKECPDRQAAGIYFFFNCHCCIIGLICDHGVSLLAQQKETGNPEMAGHSAT